MSEQIINTAVSNIHWRNSDNISRCASGLFKDGDHDANLATSLASGYKSEVGGTFAVREATTEEVKEAVEYRKALLERISSTPMDATPVEVKIGEHKVSVSASDMERVAKRMFIDAKGKIIAPKYIGVTGYRRGASFVLANAIAGKSSQEGVNEVPCTVKTFSSMKEQYIVNLAENERKTESALRPMLRDKVGAAKRLYGLGASEADIGRAFGLNRGATQKFAAICKLDQEHPDLKIVERIMSGELENAKGYTYSKVNELLKDGADSDTVEAFLKNPTDKNKAKIMKRPDIERLAEQCPVALVKLALQAVLQDDATILEKYVLKAGDVNTAIEAVVR